jgi:transposase InsO family protein
MELKKNSIDDLLEKLYYNEYTGFQGIDKLYRKAKLLNPNIRKQDVKEFLEKQSDYQLTKPIKKPKYSTIVSPSVRNNFQMDIMYLPDPSTTDGYKYLLTCVDVYSRYVFVQLLKTKTGQEVFDKTMFLFRQSGLPKNINVDLGSEFIDKKFLKFCEDNDITLWYSSPEQDNKNAIIERFHRTLRNLILKYKMASNKPYIKILPQLIKNYNTTYHNTIKNIPKTLWLGKDTNKQEIQRITYDFKVGDKVRAINPKNVFDKKSSLNTYTKKIYTITDIDGRSYYLDDLQKAYRGHELIHAIEGNEETEFDEEIRQDKIKQKQKRNLRRESINEKNIIPSKRERKPKALPQAE